MVTATDANGMVTTWTYDALNRITHITFADGLQHKMGYDANGNMTTLSDRSGSTFTFSYDRLNRMIAKSYPDKSTDTFTYDICGRLVSCTNKDADVSFTYDPAGRVKRETLNGYVTKYEYDTAAGKKSITYPSGATVTKLLNAREQIASITLDNSEVAKLDYDNAGRKSKITFANGIASDYRYNAHGWLSQIVVGNNLLDYAYTYNEAGNIVKRLDKIEYPNSETNIYDARNQLISSARGDNNPSTYKFDPVGNRTSVTENGKTSGYTVNRINCYTGITGNGSCVPQYDKNGNLLNDASSQFKYDYNNRLIEVTDKNISYKFDALGRRISKTTPQGTVLYLYAGNQMIEEFSGDKLAATHIFGNSIDEIVMSRRNGKQYYFHTDHIGSTKLVTDNDGKVAERVEYDAYGTPTFFDSNNNATSKSGIGNNILFTGREYEEEYGCYYFRARTMHPEMGRFMQMDPLLYFDGMNTLAYVNNSPVSNIDLYGLYSKVPGVTNPSGYVNTPFSRWGQAFEKGGERELKFCLDAFQKGANRAASRGAAQFADNAAARTGLIGARNLALRNLAKGGGGIFGAAIGTYFGFQDGYNGNDFLSGLIGASLGGAAGGALIGLAAGGIGAGPGALAGAAVGAGTYILGYLAGNISYNF